MYNFAEIEKKKLVRTKWRQIHTHKTTFNTGDLIPIFTKEILPGDFESMDLEAVIKMTTPSFQTMDLAFIDFHAYFVPRRLVWKNWKAFLGEKTVGPHEVQPEYTIPKTFAPTGGWEKGTIADYMGIPTKIENLPGIDSAYFRGYCLIWNEWYRDQNRQDFTDFSDGDENTDGSNGSNYVTDAIRGGKCLKAAKIHDYFTSTLLEPQAGDPVVLPLGTSAKVITGDSFNIPEGSKPLAFRNAENGNYLANNRLAIFTDSELGYTTNSTTGTVNEKVAPSNLYADLSSATAATVNQLRMAFQLQKILETNNRSGSRYVEQLKARWDVNPSDATLQRPEFLGGKRLPINMDMVVQTSSTDSTTPLGQISGFSNTHIDTPLFTKSFEEHGILYVLAVVRHQRTYQHGLAKKFTRTNMEDFYMPEFQNIGEVPVYNYEIFASGNSEKDNGTFGFQEYAAEYRYEQNIVTGQFRSNAENSFDNWHYADDYADTPVNGEEWIVENADSMDRTLTVDHTVADQFYMECGFNETVVRSMPPHSNPGYIDHH